MNKKYELTDDKLRYAGKTLHRIRALRDFSDVKAGDLGGYVESEDNLSHDGECWVCGYAKVYDNARVYNNAKVCGNARVYNNARVYGYAEVYDNARVYGYAEVYDNARVCGNAEVYGYARVYDNARVYGYAKVYDNAEVYGYARVCGNAEVYGYAKVCGNARVYNNARVYGYAKVYDNARVYNNARVYGYAKVCGNAEVYGYAEVYDNARVCRNADVQGSVILKYGKFTSDSRSDLVNVIRCSLGILPNKHNVYRVYKRVYKTNTPGEYASCYDNTFSYGLGKIIKCDNPNLTWNSSCTSGLHVSTPDYWRAQGDALLECLVKLENIITCQDGKLRVKELKVVREIQE